MFGHTAQCNRFGENFDLHRRYKEYSVILKNTILYQMDRESKASFGFLSNPASNSIIWLYQVDKLSITAEATDNLRKPGNPEKPAC